MKTLLENRNEIIFYRICGICNEKIYDDTNILN
jgi:hypothetical protein